MNLFGIDIPAIVAQAAGPLLYDATLTRVTPGAYNIADPTAGTNPTTASYTCKGVPSDNLVSLLERGLTRAFEGEVVLLLGTMSTPGIQPAPNDRITIQKPGTATTFSCVVVETDIDPAGASATCKVKA